MKYLRFKIGEGRFKLVARKKLWENDIQIQGATSYLIFGYHRFVFDTADGAMKAMDAIAAWDLIEGDILDLPGVYAYKPTSSREP